MTKIISKYTWCKGKFIPTEICHFYLFNKTCNCKEGVKKKIMASRARLKEYLDELDVDYNPRLGTVKLAELLVKEVRRIGHADDFSPDLRRTLMDDYYFHILNEKGQELNEHLELKE